MKRTRRERKLISLVSISSKMMEVVLLMQLRILGNVVEIVRAESEIVKGAKERDRLGKSLTSLHRPFSYLCAVQLLKIKSPLRLQVGEPAWRER